jgi:hypothetical protein
MADPRLSTAALGDTRALLSGGGAALGDAVLGEGSLPAQAGAGASAPKAERAKAPAPKLIGNRELRQIVWRLLFRFVMLAEDAVEVTGPDGGELRQFSLRLDDQYLPLPALPADPAKRAGAVPAKFLLLGALQQYAEAETAGASRATMRVVSAETSEVKSAGKGTAEGLDAQAVDVAVKLAFLDMGIVFGVPGARVRV